jgi:glutathionylspermidine synthase
VERQTLTPRADWQAKVEDLGLVWHTAGPRPYWNEAACYTFTLPEIETVEAATAELYRLFLEAGDYVVDKRLFSRFGIPDWCHPLIADAWRSEPPALNYGRFDLGFDGKAPPKLFEFNCDTPTALLEAAVVQWQWKEDCFPKNDQFNGLHDALVAKWRDIAPFLTGRRVHFAYAPDDTGEDAVTTAYLMDTAREAGLEGRTLRAAEIGWAESCFWDLQDQEIRTLYHLYPWEWLVSEPFGRNIVENRGRTTWIEPIWKMIWSNKAILPILWQLFPKHPNLLAAFADGPPPPQSYVRKPILAREGANIQVVRNGREVASTGGAYGGGKTIYQAYYDLPEFDGQRPVIGSWIVDGEPAGIGIREDGLITGNLARFVPHVIA